MKKFLFKSSYLKVFVLKRLMNLIIDNRENDLIQLIEKSDIDFEKKGI